MAGIGKLIKAGAKVAKKVATKTDAGKAIHNLKAAKKDAAMMKHLERKYPAIADKDSFSVANKTQTYGSKLLKTQDSKWVMKPDNTKKSGVNAVKEITERPMKTKIGIKGQSAKDRQHRILRLRHQDRIDNAKKYGKTAAARIGSAVGGTSAIAGMSSIISKNKQREEERAKREGFDSVKEFRKHMNGLRRKTKDKKKRDRREMEYARKHKTPVLSKTKKLDTPEIKPLETENPTIKRKYSCGGKMKKKC